MGRELEESGGEGVINGVQRRKNQREQEEKDRDAHPKGKEEIVEEAEPRKFQEHKEKHRQGDQVNGDVEGKGLAEHRREEVSGLMERRHGGEKREGAPGKKIGEKLFAGSVEEKDREGR